MLVHCCVYYWNQLDFQTTTFHNQIVPSVPCGFLASVVPSALQHHLANVSLLPRLSSTLFITSPTITILGGAANRIIRSTNTQMPRNTVRVTCYLVRLYHGFVHYGGACCPDNVKFRLSVTFQGFTRNRLALTWLHLFAQKHVFSSHDVKRLLFSQPTIFLRKLVLWYLLRTRREDSVYLVDSHHNSIVFSLCSSTTAPWPYWR